MANAIPVIVKGDTKQFQITSIKGPDGSLYTLSETDKLYMDIKKSSASSVLIHKVITAENYTEDGALGFSLFPIETKKLSKGNYVFDVRLVISDTEIFTVIPETTVTVVNNITDIPEGEDAI